MTAISKNKVTTRQAFRRLDTFIKLAKPRARKNPLLVTLLMHEYFRNLYPVDPFIPKRIPGDHLKNIMVCLDNCIEILLKADSLGTYFSSRRPLSAAFSVPQVRQTADGPTQKVYGRLWKKLSAQ